MIRLTDVQGNVVYINPDRVIGIHLRDDVGTRVNYGGESYVVRESPEEVARKVLEWRLAWEGGDVETLYQMAGLEEQYNDERLKKEAEQREKLVECLRFYERLARGREINDGGRRARTLLAEIGVTVE